MKENLIIIDSHCDTLLALNNSNKELKENDLHFDLKSALEYKAYIQFFAAWVDKKLDNPLAQCLKLADRFYLEIENNKDTMMPVFNKNNIITAIETKKVGALLSVEGGEALAGDLGILRMFYKLGIRSVCLTWNYRNEIADPAIDLKSRNGLSGFGLDVISEMNKLGMIIDVSHLSEKGFYDVIEATKDPIMATHSCSKTKCGHFRNLTDDQFKTLIKNGGVVGINYCPAFLEDSCSSDVKSIVTHIEHFMSLGGEDYIGIGSDFDGIDDLPNGIDNVGHTYKIFEELAKLNYTESQISKISYRNTLRLVSSVLK